MRERLIVTCVSCKWEKKSLILCLKYSTVLWWGVLEANEDSFEVCCPIKTTTGWSSNQIKVSHYVNKHAFWRLSLPFFYNLYVVFTAFRWCSVQRGQSWMDRVWIEQRMCLDLSFHGHWSKVTYLLLSTFIFALVHNDGEAHHHPMHLKHSETVINWSAAQIFVVTHALKAKSLLYQHVWCKLNWI